MWTPRKGSTMRWHLEKQTGKHLDYGGEEREKAKKIFTNYGIKSDSFGTVHINWPGRKFQTAYSEISLRLSEIGVRLAGSLHESAYEANERSWYDIRTHGAEPDMAIRMRKDMHFGYVRMYDYTNHSGMIVSQLFVDTVREHRLRGLSSCPFRQRIANDRMDGVRLSRLILSDEGSTTLFWTLPASMSISFRLIARRWNVEKANVIQKKTGTSLTRLELGIPGSRAVWRAGRLFSSHRHATSKRSCRKKSTSRTRAWAPDKCQRL
jgi:hypothetical protein